MLPFGAVAVKPAGTKSVYLYGLVVNQPVCQVKVVGRFVNEQRTGVLPDRVPAPEVIRAVGGVQQPLKVNAENIPQHSAGNQLL